MSLNIDKKIGQATIWSTVTEIVAKLITPIVNMVLARLLVPEAFGVVATITMVISFAEIFTDAGFQKYIVQHEFESEEDLDNSTNVAFLTNLSFSILICAIIFIFRHKLAILVGSNGFGNSISVASVLIIIASFSSIQMARYKRDFDFKNLFKIRIITSVLPLFLTIPLAFILRNYWALLIGTFVTNLANATILTIKSKWKPKLYYNFNLLKEMFSFTCWTLLESLSIWLIAYSDIFIIGNRFDDYYLGLYKTSISVVNSFLNIITASITPVLFSALSRYQNDDVKYKETFYTLQKLVAIFVIPMGIGVYVYHDIITKILLGNAWMEASEFVGYWGLTSSLVIVYSYFSSEVYRSKGNPKLSLGMQLMHLVFLITTLLIASNYDFRTIYISRSLIRLQDIVWALLVMCIVYKFKSRIIFKNTLPIIIASTFMGIVGTVMLTMFDSLIVQLASIFVCVIFYFSTLFLFPNIRKFLLQILRNKKIF